MGKKKGRSRRRGNIKKKRERRAGRAERKRKRCEKKVAREAYDLEERRREVKRDTSGEIKIESESFSCYSHRRHPRPPD